MDLKLYTVEEEYLNNPELKKSDVEIIQEWMLKQPHLPRVTELQLIWFLRSCKNSIELTKTSLDNYFTVKTHCPELFNTPSRTDIEKALAAGIFTVFPKRTPDGYDVFVCGDCDCPPDIEKLDTTSMVRTIVTCLMMQLHLHGSSKGIILISDMKVTGLSHMMRTNLTVVRKMLYFLEQAAPFPLKSLHMVNINSYTDKIMGLLRPLMSKDITDMLFVHSKMDSLHDHVPKDCLPEEYGGSMTSNLSQLQHDFGKVLLDNLCILRMEDSMKVDESKRQGKPKNVGDIFGVEGSFRKLDID